MKKILISVQEELSKIEELKYIDKDWGQLSYEQPPVKFPCALLDVANIDYTQIGAGRQQAFAHITITICGLRLQNTSANAPETMRLNAYSTIDLLDAVHNKLQLFSNGEFAPLQRVNLSKIIANNNYEVYTMTYKTGFVS